MPYLHVSVRLNDTVVDDRLCEIEGLTWLGDVPQALVAFPGGVLWVEPQDDQLLVRGVPLGAGESVTLNYGAVQVVLEGGRPERLERDWSWAPDPALMLATAALVLAGAFVDLWAMGQAPPQTLVAQAERASGQVKLGVPGYEEPHADTGTAASPWTPTVTFTAE